MFNINIFTYLPDFSYIQFDSSSLENHLIPWPMRNSLDSITFKHYFVITTNFHQRIWHGTLGKHCSFQYLQCLSRRLYEQLFFHSGKLLHLDKAKKTIKEKTTSQRVFKINSRYHQKSQKVFTCTMLTCYQLIY